MRYSRCRAALVAVVYLSWAAVGGCGSGGTPAGEGGDAGSGAGSDAGPAPVHVPNPVDVETIVPDKVQAGDVLPVDCTILDASGEVYSSVGRTRRVRVAPESSIQRVDGDIVPVRAGEIEVHCAFPDLMLTDATPARVQVLPGGPGEIITHVERNTVEAGESVEASCEVFDGYGNRIEDASPGLRVEPMQPGNATEGMSATFTTSGIYDVRCHLDATTTTAARVEVVPTLPAHLAIARIPDAPVYGIGQVIEIGTVVTDRYDNEIPDADVMFDSDPAGSTLGRGRFRYAADGTYEVTATVAPPSESGEPLTASTTLIVNGTGPEIRCDSPGDGTMIEAAPGSTVTFSGHVEDVSGTESVTVNGEPAPIGAGGEFSVSLLARFGINFVDIVATDGFGVENTRTCAFLASEHYADPSPLLDDVIALKLTGRAIDDGFRHDLDSMGDLLEMALNSGGLREELDAALTAANPLIPRQCVQDSWFGCLYWLQVDYQPGTLEVSESSTTTLELVHGGIRAEAHIPWIRMGIDVSGTANTSGTATAEDTDISLVFDVSRAGGAPRLTVRPGTVSVRIGSFDTNLSGLSGFILDIIVDLFEGRVRGMLEDEVADFVRDSFDSVLEGMLSGLDVRTLGRTFEVPALGDAEPLEIGFGVGLSSLSTSPSRMLLGLGTRVSGPSRVGHPTRGIAHTTPMRADPHTTFRPAVAGVQVALLNQLLHALWRGGLLETTVDGGELGGGSSDGVTATLHGALPPVASLTDEGVEMGIGALTVQLTIPGLFDEPLVVDLGARARSRATLSDGDLEFDRITVEELVLSTSETSLDEETREVLEGFFRTLVQSLVDRFLNDALPAFPLPSFELPRSLDRFGLPGGSEIGMRLPRLQHEPPHFVVRSYLGVL